MIPEWMKTTLDDILDRPSGTLAQAYAFLFGISEDLVGRTVCGHITNQDAKREHNELVEAREYVDRRINERHAAKGAMA